MGTLATPPIDLPLHHHLLRPHRLGEISVGDQQVTLLGDPWRVAKPRAEIRAGETHVAVPFTCRPSSSGTVVASPRLGQNSPSLHKILDRLASA
jgi:hypothetical protein